MGYSSWPSITEFLGYVKSNYGVTIDETTASLWLNSAIEEFSRDTGWEPFLTNGNSQIEFPIPDFSSGKQILYTGNGLHGTTVIEYVDGGTQLVEGTDYRIVGRNSIEFITGVSGRLLITSEWGYDTSIPSDVVALILERAVVEYGSANPTISMRVNSTDLKQDTVQFKSNQNRTLRDSHQNKYNDIVAGFIKTAETLEDGTY